MDKILFDNITFANRLKTLREIRGYKTKRAFAQAFVDRFRCGNQLAGNDPVSGFYATYKNYENPNYTGAPQFDIVVQICDLLDCDTDYLLGKIDEPKHIYQAFLDQCGLSNSAVNNLLYWNQHGSKRIDTLNYILISANFENALYHASELMKAKPQYLGLSEIFEDWRAKTYSSPPPAGGYPDCSGLRESLKRAETKYGLERLYLNEYLGYLVTELEEISLKKKR